MDVRGLVTSAALRLQTDSHYELILLKQQQLISLFTGLRKTL